MVRLCSKSSRSLLREACAPGSSATKGGAVREDRRASTGVSRGHSTGRYEPVTTPDGLTTREGLNLAGRHDHRWSCPGAMRPNRPSYGQRSSWQRKSAASFRKDCQEPPYADPHVRWCWRREGKLSRRPDLASLLLRIFKPLLLL